MRRAAATVHRAFDVVVATFALTLTAPLAVLIAAAIRADSPGPVIFRARRVGVNGREFVMFKFRTMCADREPAGPGITASDDPRVTRVGRWLRPSKLDEWPQLVNVIAGEMSLVGPRPEDPRYVASYSDQQRQVLRVRPGVTSVASLAFRDEEALLVGPDSERRYREEILPEKLAMEVGYLGRASWTGNLAVLWRTAVHCLTRCDTSGAGRGAGSRRGRRQDRR